MPKFSIKIFLPAAGLGERLRPITYHIPKPLLPILGKPLIEITLEKFSVVSSGEIGINLHYKADMMKDWVTNSVFAGHVEFFPESPILGTGGALKNAERFLSGGPFLVHNADILSNIDLERLIDAHLSSGNIATLATHDYLKYNNVVIDDNGCVIDVENPGKSIPNPERIARKIAYTGIAIYSPEILRFLPVGVSHATVAWLAASKAGHKVQALDFTGSYWSDIGTPATYASAIVNALRNDGETVYIHPSVKKCSSTEIDGYIVIEEGNELGQNVSLRNCIVLPKANPLIRQGELFENCILGPDFKIDLNETEILGYSEEAGGILIGIGGSNREYYRIKKAGSSAVLMKCGHGDPDYHRHLEYTKFFSKYSIPVPEITEETPDKFEAVFEDLGDVTLYSWLKCRREPEQIEGIYRKVLDIAVKIHTDATQHISECPMLQERLFDYEHYRWETGYFFERFIEGIKNIKIKNPRVLQDQFHNIAEKAGSFPKTIIHRDFQSQNIMIHNGIPRLIDFQGARMGLPAYDIASILWDPYYRLDDNMRERLLEYYLNKMTATNTTIHLETLILCRLQRHMQALGAYGFLSKIKGKKYFLKHIPEGLRLLKEDITLVKNDYPELYRLVMEL
ncbi:MAG: DUF1679 domain-containing protein [Nitrospirae bacterium]|nr:MAG: DUF1679 domain-containing protein [Nitrospirota bacterium]